MKYYMAEVGGYQMVIVCETSEEYQAVRSLHPRGRRVKRTQVDEIRAHGRYRNVLGLPELTPVVPANFILGGTL